MSGFDSMYGINLDDRASALRPSLGNGNALIRGNGFLTMNFQHSEPENSADASSGGNPQELYER